MSHAAPGRALPLGRAFSPEFLRLREAALGWIDSYYDREHLTRAADWALELEPRASEPLVLALLLHDMERAVPGGPVFDKARTAWDDPEYNRHHCERSARVVTDWLRDQQAPDRFVEGVIRPILEHEFGGSPEGDLAQAADSLSWLEVNAQLAVRWVVGGECDLAKAQAKLEWMRYRIREPRGRELAGPLFGSALEHLNHRVSEELQPLSWHDIAVRYRPDG